MRTSAALLISVVADTVRSETSVAKRVGTVAAAVSFSGEAALLRRAELLGDRHILRFRAVELREEDRARRGSEVVPDMVSASLDRIRPVESSADCMDALAALAALARA